MEVISRMSLVVNATLVTQTTLRKFRIMGTTNPIGARRISQVTTTFQFPCLLNWISFKNTADCSEIHDRWSKTGPSELTGRAEARYSRYEFRIEDKELEMQR